MSDDIRATPHNRASREALRIYAEVLDGVRADRLMHDSVRRRDTMLEIQDKRLDLSSFGRVYICGAGKASFAMAQALAEIVGPYLSGGLVITKHGHGGTVPGLRVLEAAHPVPDESSLEAGRQMLDFAASTNPDDLVLFCLSGGASSLMESLRDGVTLAELKELNRKMLSEGKDITEINAARSKLSKIKAGGLAAAFAKPRVGVLVLSDVMGGGPETIGSGPFWTEDSDEWILIGTGDYWDQGDGPGYHHKRFKGPYAPVSDRAGNGTSAEPRRVFHRFVGNWMTALTLALRSAGDYTRPVLSDDDDGTDPRAQHKNLQTRPGPILSGDARDEAARIATAAKKLRPHEFRVFVGETAVTLRGNGRGGRCQELACAAAPLIEGEDDLAILAGSTDGTDGPTDVGAALVDGGSVARAQAKGITAEAALANSDSFRFLEASDGLIYTGPTQSNVNDIVIAIRYPAWPDDSPSG